MVSTIDRLLNLRNESKVVVWEHNTHIGDARATDMATGRDGKCRPIIERKYTIDELLGLDPTKEVWLLAEIGR
jgi:erythromycin esterase-like protein